MTSADGRVEARPIGARTLSRRSLGDHNATTDTDSSSNQGGSTVTVSNRVYRNKTLETKAMLTMERGTADTIAL